MAKAKKADLWQRALLGLKSHDLQPLIDLLDELSPPGALTRELRLLHSGSPAETDFRLIFAPHPEQRHWRHSMKARREQESRENKTAIRMARNGGLNHGKFEAAVTATVAETGLSRATVARHWRRRKAHIQHLISVDLLRLNEEVRVR